MCTVLQQHLNQTNGGLDEPPRPPSSPPPQQATEAAAESTPASFYARHISPVRLHSQPTYSYLQVKKPRRRYKYISKRLLNN